MIKIRLSEHAATAVWVVVIWSAFWYLTAFMLWGDWLYHESLGVDEAARDVLDWRYFNYD